MHKDRSLKSCYINTNIKPRDAPFQIAREFNRIKRQVTTFQYNPEEIEISDVTKQVKNNKAIDVIVFSIKYTKLTTELKTQLKKLKKMQLKSHEIKWLIKQHKKGYEYLETLSANDIVACGEEANNIMDTMSKDKTWAWFGNMKWFLDKHGLMEQVFERRKHKEHMSESAFGTDKWNF